ncbi:MAG: alpha/beta hydrolase family protein [Acidimicrobiia bacterium]
MRARPGSAWWITVVVVALAAAGCSSGSASTASSPRPSGADPAYAKRGPYAVGVTTLSLPDRKVEVYYPAKHGSTDGRPSATYTETDPIPPSVLAGLPKIPAGVDLTVKIPAVRDVPVATDGPFPLVIFSHGAGGWRGVYGYPLSGIASWGFVVASTDYAEYGLLAQFSGGGSGGAAQNATVHAAATATVDLMTAENRDGQSRLHAAVDTKRIGAIGHSAGGGTMFGLLDDPRVGAIVGWAPVGPKPPVTSDTPTMVIGGEQDIAITPASATRTYESLQPPKRLVEIGKMGHNAFSDACLAIRGGTDLIGLAKQLGIGIPESLLALGRNGCEAGALDTKRGWSIIQHFTVAELRSALGIDRVPVGLGPGIANAFPGVTITYRQQLR